MDVAVTVLSMKGHVFMPEHKDILLNFVVLGLL